MGLLKQLQKESWVTVEDRDDLGRREDKNGGVFQKITERQSKLNIRTGPLSGVTCTYTVKNGLLQ